jgi:hypothetical protein
VTQTKTNSSSLSMWVVYDHPLDYPDKFVARLWVGEQPTQSIIIANDLAMIRDTLCFEMHKVCLARNPEDDPKILEMWL